MKLPFVSRKKHDEQVRSLNIQITEEKIKSNRLAVQLIREKINAEQE